MKTTSFHRNSGTRWAKVIGFVFATMCLFALYHGAIAQSSSLDNKVDAQKEKLKKIRQDIERHRARTRELGREEKSVLKQLSEIDRDVSLSKKYLNGLEEREGLLEEQIDSLRVHVALENMTLNGQKRRLEKRLRRMYMSGPNHKWEFILGGSNIQQILRRYKFQRVIAENDARLVDTVTERKTELEREQAEMTEVLADIATLKKVKEQEAGSLEANKRTRVAMLKKVRSERTNHTQAIEELKQSEEKLKSLIDQLEEKRMAGGDDSDLPSGDFAALKGGLIRPVEGKITRGFGRDRHPKFGTVTFNNGVDIKASAGTPIRCVAAGRVEFVDWIAGYGNCVIINHGGGYYTLYAHAQEIFVEAGQSVSRKQVIAEVGDTGSLDGYQCHFEIRKSKQALDPKSWFAK